MRASVTVAAAGYLRDHQNHNCHFPQGSLQPVLQHPYGMHSIAGWEETLATAAGDAALAVQEGILSQAIALLQILFFLVYKEKVRSKEKYVSSLEDCAVSGREEETAELCRPMWQDIFLEADDDGNGVLTWVHMTAKTLNCKLLK